MAKCIFSIFIIISFIICCNNALCLSPPSIKLISKEPKSSILKINKKLDPAAGALCLRSNILKVDDIWKNTLFIPLSTKCPFKFCPHCCARVLLTKNNNVDLEEETIFSWLRQLKGTQRIAFYGPGEPTFYGK